VLYKQSKDRINEDVFNIDKPLGLYIRRKDESYVVEKLLSTLNMDLAKTISSKGVGAIKQSVCQILQEALEGPLETSLSSLPETVEILFYQARKTPELLDALTSMNNNSPKLIEHSVNVLALTAQYCFYKKYSDDELKKFGLCALLHDVGAARIDRKIIESDRRLSAKDFNKYKFHPFIGSRQLESYSIFDKSVVDTAAEHHELLDGSGYPAGLKNISFEAQVIGLINSYELLTHHQKIFRPLFSPFDTMQKIKEDVIKGKYNKNVFIDLCSCLIK